MPRASKSRVIVEAELTGDNAWSELEAAAGKVNSILEAEEWILNNIGNRRLRAVRISGIFERKSVITKR